MHWSDQPKKKTCHYCGGERKVMFIFKRCGSVSVIDGDLAECPLCG